MPAKKNKRTLEVKKLKITNNIISEQNSKQNSKSVELEGLQKVNKLFHEGYGLQRLSEILGKNINCLEILIEYNINLFYKI